MKKKLDLTFNDIISIDNLLEAWSEFVKGKRGRKDVQEFQRHLMENIITLHQELKDKKYKHSAYEAFNISDPKPRNIHKAKVRDRLLHHAIYRALYPFFDRKFIADSYSCRKKKGVHKALKAFRAFTYEVSDNHTKTAWVLKCDIKKFFASINHQVLIKILGRCVLDENILWLLAEVVGSFSSTQKGVGLPLGNLTSQLLVNIYMNEFDQFVKHKLKAKYYVRYADDFVFLSEDKEQLLSLLFKVKEFLEGELKLSLHPHKVSITTLASGVDFLGWVHFTDHRVLRTTTKRRALKNMREKEGKEDTLQSYLGLLSHGNAYKVSKKLLYFQQ